MRTTWTRTLVSVVAGCLAAALLPGTAAADEPHVSMDVSARSVAPGGRIEVSGTCRAPWGTAGTGTSVSVGRETEFGSGKSWRQTSMTVSVSPQGRFDAVVAIPEVFVPDRYEVSAGCFLEDQMVGEAVAMLEVTGVDRRPRFSDVTGSYLHSEAVRELAAAGVTVGCGGGRFCPGEPVTRAQAASMLARQLGLEGASSSFVDVPVGSTHAPAIGALQRAGIVAGCAADRFCPDETLRRDQAASLLARATGWDRRGDPDDHVGFVDVPRGSAHWRSVNVLASVGTVRGCAADRFCPDSGLTRAQAARLLHRVFGYGD